MFLIKLNVLFILKYVIRTAVVLLQGVMVCVQMKRACSCKCNASLELN